MKRKYFSLLIFTLLLCLLLSACAGSDERAWRSGQKALAEENFSEAAAAFEKAGDFQDSGLLLQYARASQALLDGNYPDAVSGFQALGDFKDSLLMVSYTQAREQESIAQASPEDVKMAVNANLRAYELYSSLPLFRDSDTRAVTCRDRIYEQSQECLKLSRFDDAAAGFAALGDWQDSAMLQTYCVAAGLEQQGSFADAADLFAEIPETLDAASREESAREQAYRQALTLKENGDYEAASAAFARLGSYQDAAEQCSSAQMLLVRDLLDSGSCLDALTKLTLLPDPSVFPELDAASLSGMETFLSSFLNVWMNAHARVMTSFFGINLLQPYLLPGGELDTQIRAELTDDIAPTNYGFVFQGAALEQLLQLDEAFSAAKVHASASYVSPEGQVQEDEDLWILLDTSHGNPVVMAVLEA